LLPALPEPKASPNSGLIESPCCEARRKASDAAKSLSCEALLRLCDDWLLLPPLTDESRLKTVLAIPKADMMPPAANNRCGNRKLLPGAIRQE
jgi:hypothetical protein